MQRCVLRATLLCGCCRRGLLFGQERLAWDNGEREEDVKGIVEGIKVKCRFEEELSSIEVWAGLRYRREVLSH